MNNLNSKEMSWDTFTKVAQLGSGTYGDVWKVKSKRKSAHCLVDQKTYVIKCIDTGVEGSLDDSTVNPVDEVFV